MSVSNTNNLVEKLSVMRGISIIFVMLIHATGPDISIRNGQAGCSTIFLILLNQLSRFCVPVFFFITGYLYTLKFSYKKLNYPVYITGRIKKIFIPYLLWTVIYLSFRIITGSIDTGNLDFLKTAGILFTGKAYGHLYFISAIFQFYLLLPVFILLAKLFIRIEHKWWVFLALIILSTCLFQWKIAYLNQAYGGSFLTDDAFFIWWMPFILFGILAGTGFNPAADRITIPLSAVAVAAVFILMNYEYICAYNNISFYYSAKITAESFDSMASFLRPSAGIYAFLSIFLLTQVLTKGSGKVSRVLTEAGKYSFAIYLAHPLINKCLFKIIKLTGLDPYGKIWGVGIEIFIGSLLSYIIARQLLKIKGMTLLFGGVR